ncbi:hypothetical protein EJ06DRAFT_179687 [Trichodelitschia bisporula]|uniref:Uncharacterized protein n=1 Tax=Trichodelitschia bisporula TaxID=703511 RepID=A0A6G1HM11_9PEZI|nr:hypothetical protein EJ06DRAFT_179687 [Trichodelitschia bisporula]
MEGLISPSIPHQQFHPINNSIPSNSPPTAIPPTARTPTIQPQTRRSFHLPTNQPRQHDKLHRNNSPSETTNGHTHINGRLPILELPHSSTQ